MENEPIDQSPIRCKTIIVGDSGVGKTSIISRYLKKYNEKEKSTIGASFTNKLETVDGKVILFEIWDTAGQERYRSINNIFYQDAYICLLVYDITKKESFDNIKEYWYKSVLEESNEKTIFHIVGNKIDLLKDETVDRKEVKDYCDNIGADLSFISAKDENENYIDILFQRLGEKFINSDIYKENNTMIKKYETKKIYFDDDTSVDRETKKQKRCC